MLVLTRRAGDAVVIDGRIQVKVLRIRGNHVHLGIEAPAETPIQRHEVWVRQQEGEDAASTGHVEGDEPEPS